MSPLAVVGLVMSREIRQRLRSRAFLVSTVLLCVGVLVAGVLNRVLAGDDEPTRYDVATVGAAPEGFDDADAGAAEVVGQRVDVRSVDDRTTADEQLRDGGLDAAIDVGAGQLVSEEAPAGPLVAALDAAWRRVGALHAAQEAGLDDAATDAILSPARLAAARLGADRDDDGVALAVGFASAIVLFISINAFGGMVLTGVVEEKTTGVVEVLLAHVRAHQLLAGKVLGIGAVAMVQLGAAVASGLIALRISGRTVPGAVWVGLPTTLLWFVGGFILYSTLYALAGSCVSRQEDAQGAAAPISVVFTAAYLTVFALGAEPTGTVTRIVSVLPPFAPLLMPVRIAAGAASVAEIVVAAVLLAAALIGMLRLAGSVYGRTLLHRGSRLRWRQALTMRGR